MDDIDPVQSAHLAPGGPALAAGAWFSAIVDHSDLSAAWRLTDRPLRVALVQSWMIATGLDDTPARQSVADAIADNVGHARWSAFAEWRLRRWRENTFKSFVADGWGLVSVPELVGPDLEFVRVAPGREGRELSADDPIFVQTLTVRFVEGVWLVAGIGRSLPNPGWPPYETSLRFEDMP